jgi:hypothetical protein
MKFWLYKLERRIEGLTYLEKNEMKKNLLSLASVVLCLGFAIDGLAQNTLAQKNTSCGQDVTSLRVTIDGTAGNALLPDGQGDYVNLSQFQVNNCTFDFTMNLNHTTRYMTYLFPAGSVLPSPYNFTFFNMDRIASVPPTDGGYAYTHWCGTVQTSGGAIVQNTEGYYQDNYAPCGKDPDTYDANGNLVPGRYFVRRSYGSTLNDNYHLRFNYSPFDNTTGISLAAGTAYVKVYASVDPTGPQLLNSKGWPLPNTWEMVPDVVDSHPGGATDPGPWSMLLHYTSTKGRTTAEVAGYQKTPFRMTVKRLQ